MTSQKQALNIPRKDGDTVRLWVKALDSFNREKTDEVVIHIDSTPPEIGKLWLKRDGWKGLAVHNARELDKME